MKFVALLPWGLKIDGEEQLDAAMYQVDEGEAASHKCESWDEFDPCSPQPFVFGTSDGREPKFCFKHYFQINDGDGNSNYQIVPHFEK